MQFNVAQLLKEHSGATRSYAIDDDVVSEEGTTEHVKGTLDLMRTDKGIWASAQLKVSRKTTCSRCLRRFPMAMELSIQEEYLPIVDIITGERLFVPESAEGTFTLTGQHMLDLDEAVRQYLITSAPMKPLCRPDCAGLCPTCGKNLNTGRCGCQSPVIDPRWAPLTRLLPRGEG